MPPKGTEYLAIYCEGECIACTPKEGGGEDKLKQYLNQLQELGLRTNDLEIKIKSIEVNWTNSLTVIDNVLKEYQGRWYTDRDLKRAKEKRSTMILEVTEGVIGFGKLGEYFQNFYTYEQAMVLNQAYQIVEQLKDQFLQYLDKQPLQIEISALKHFNNFVKGGENLAELFYTINSENDVKLYGKPDFSSKYGFLKDCEIVIKALLSPVTVTMKFEVREGECIDIPVDEIVNPSRLSLICRILSDLEDSHPFVSDKFKQNEINE